MTSIRFAARASILAVLVLGLGGLSAFAQFSSGIEGTVTETSGAVVAGAKVSLKDVQIGVTKETTTNQSGYFRFDSIGASTYDVEVQLTGFKSWELKGLILQPGKSVLFLRCFRSDRCRSISRFRLQSQPSTW